MIRISLLVVFITLIACKPDTKNAAETTTLEKEPAEATAYEEAEADPMQFFRGSTVDTRFLVPEGYVRKPVEEESFGNYLRKLPLKVPGSQITFYDGMTQEDIAHHAAVVNLPIGDKDLHQCADAIIRLKAEHLWLQKKYEDIHFDFTNGMRVDYSKWMKGGRIKVDGNKTSWIDGAEPSTSYSSFWAYLEQIFMYAGTLSLSKELTPIKPTDIQIGDIFIVGGSPGHAIIVVDLATNVELGKTAVIVAQSYMPAQELHIIKNKASKISPWFELELDKPVSLTEWNFQWGDLKRFK